MPQPKDIYDQSAKRAVKELAKVSEEMLPVFTDAAKQAIEEHEGDVESALAAAIALIAGFPRPIDGRSLLSGVQGYRSVLVAGTTSFSFSFIVCVCVCCGVMMITCLDL